mgnify:CR=1 FL=1
MNKVDVIRNVISLSKRSHYTVSFHLGNQKYSFDENSLDYVTVEFGSYFDTGGGWLKYYTKDVAKYYELNPVEMLLIRNLF